MCEIIQFEWYFFYKLTFFFHMKLQIAKRMLFHDFSFNSKSI